MPSVGNPFRARALVQLVPAYGITNCCITWSWVLTTAGAVFLLVCMVDFSTDTLYLPEYINWTSRHLRYSKQKGYIISIITLPVDVIHVTGNGYLSFRYLVDSDFRQLLSFNLILTLQAITNPIMVNFLNLLTPVIVGCEQFMITELTILFLFLIFKSLIIIISPLLH